MCVAGGADLMARAPWNRPGESRAIRNLRIFIFFTVIAGCVIAVAALAWFVVFTLGNIS